MRGLRVSIPLIFVLTACVALYRNCLDGFFLADDFGYIQLFSQTSLGTFPRLFTADWSQGIWGFDLQEMRPLTGLTYWLDYRMWGANPFGYHLENLILYMLSLAGLYLLIVETARALMGPASEEAIRWKAALGAFLFLVHPAHVEAVAWIAGRTDLLGGVTYVWGMYCLARYWRQAATPFAVAGIVVFGVGLFMKENVITLPAAFWIYAAMTGEMKRKWKQLAVVSGPLVALTLLWVVLRMIAFGSIGRAANFGGIRGFFLRLPSYASQSLPQLPSASVFVLPLLMVTYAAYGLYRWNTGGRMIVFWGIGWTAVTLAPLMAVSYESPRHIFLALAGPLTALSSAAAMWRFERRLIPIAALGLSLIIGIQLARRTQQWLPVWIESSAYSRQLFQLLKTSHFGSTDVVVLNSGPPVPIFFWQWALPFAVERPFMDFPARIVAGPDWYCCAEWQVRRDSILKEIDSGAVQRIHRIEFNTATHRFEER